ncbi:hypothetical protein BKA63DRAFT_414645 [Paraphoma chrysanthemicola]|nr:hypothetical protein BKA63DRAFT_414645 [Paraphoma chrysanthemicola]
MPIKWTPELDTILLHGVFEECNISFSKALCEKLAQRVRATGVEASSKAVENRLYSWKKKNVGSGTNATSTPSKVLATPKTPNSRAKATGRKKKLATPSESENDGPEGLIDSPSVKKSNSKRAKSTPKRSHAESEDEHGIAEVEEEYAPLAKKVKTEPVDDAGGVLGLGLGGLEGDFGAAV